MGIEGEVTSLIIEEKRKVTDDTNKTILNVIVDAMCEKKASDIVDINLSGLRNSICDHFIIANADSSTQVSAIADNVEEKMIQLCQTKVIRRNGNENALWIILDYGDVMVHVFQTEYRNFYRLDELWADGIVTKYDN